MDNWKEIKTAYEVARTGTISAAAEALGVHRATVLRHVDSLETRLGEKLFLRHSRGYTPTDAGEDLMRVAKATDEQFNHFLARTTNPTAELAGELVVTSLEVVAPKLLPALNAFRVHHPRISVRYVTSDKLFKLEYGEAHVAVRTGPEPQEPDNVVRPFITFRVGLYAHRNYVSANGSPTSKREFHKHMFVGTDSPSARGTFQKWQQRNIPMDRLVFRSNNPWVLEHAVFAGTGIGFVIEHHAKAQPDLVEVMAPRPEWDVVFWLVTHADLHRTAKVQALLKCLKQVA